MRRPLRAHPEYDPSRMTRKEVANFLHVSIATVQRLELLGKIKGEKGEYTVDGRPPVVRIWFNRSDVEALSATWKPAKRVRRGGARPNARGRMAAHILRSFLAGKDINEVIIETEADPDFVLEVWEEMQLSPETRVQLRESRRLEKESEKRMRGESMRAYYLRLAELHAKGRASSTKT